MPNYRKKPLHPANKYLSNAMNRAVGARERLGWVTIPGAMPQAEIKRAFGPKLAPHVTVSGNRLAPLQPLTHFQSHAFSLVFKTPSCRWRSILYLPFRT